MVREPMRCQRTGMDFVCSYHKDYPCCTTLSKLPAGISHTSDVLFKLEDEQGDIAELDIESPGVMIRTMSDWVYLTKEQLLWLAEHA